MDLSVIIKKNFLKNSNWNNHRFLEEESMEDQNKKGIREDLIDFNLNDRNREICSLNNRTNIKDDDNIEARLSCNFHDENCNIKVE